MEGEKQGGRTESKTLDPSTQSSFLSPLIKHGLKKKPTALDGWGTQLALGETALH